MTRFPPLFVLPALIAAACSKDPAPRAEPAPDRTAAKATTAADRQAPEPTERVSKTGVLDLELAAAGKRHSLRNATFEVTFPSRPTVQSQQDRTPDGAVVTSAMAFANHGSEQLAFAMTPMPKDQPYDAKAGINGARDGAIRNVGAKLEREEDVNVGGLPGKKVTATVRQGGQTIYIDMHLVWDASHHQLIYAMTASPHATPSKVARDFVASLRIKADAAAKAAPAASPPT